MELTKQRIDIKQITDHLLPGNLICIAGRLGSGKTTLLQQIKQMSEAAAKGSTVLISPENPHNDFDNAPYISAETIRQHLLEIRSQKEIKLVLIDNLCLLDDLEGDKGEGLKRLAVDLILPVVVSCHLRRATGKRPDGQPTISDFEEVLQEVTPDVMIFLFDDSDHKCAYSIKLSHENDGSVIDEITLLSF